MIEGLSGALAARLRRDQRRVVVIDDDPTGTQTVSDVDVILTPDQRAYEDFFTSDARAIYVLSNTRALHEAAAARHVRGIADGVRAAAAAANRSVAIVLRGDSTLRGHVFAEIDAVGSAEAVVLFVPAFPEGGRVTVDGVQWLQVDGAGRVPVSETEFARDGRFSYESRALDDWVAEVGDGRSAMLVPLAVVRSAGPRAIREALLTAPAGSVVIPEAESYADLELATIGLLDAEAAGREVVVRSASTFAAIRAGLVACPIQQVTIAKPGRILVVCGSHTAVSTEQLRHLSNAAGIEPIELPPVWSRPASNDASSALTRLAETLADELDARGFAILATSRTPLAGAREVMRGAMIMDALVETVVAVRARCDGLIAKGGITSAELTRRGFEASIAHVKGQLAPGVALWEMQGVPARRIPCAVVPGNVGGPELLVDVARRFGVDL